MTAKLQLTVYYLVRISAVQLFRRDTVSGKKLIMCLLVEVFIDLRHFPEGTSSNSECLVLNGRISNAVVSEGKLSFSLHMV